MQIVPFRRLSAVTQLLTPIDPSLAGEAANDSGTYDADLHQVCDLNVLVAGVVGLVSGRVQPNKVNIELTLAPGRPLVQGDPKDVAFAFSGVLGAELRTLEESDGGDLRVETRFNGSSVQILVAASDLPPLDFIRAIQPGFCAGDSDPTFVHCRRLIEACGGQIDLIERDGLIGFAISLPTVPALCPVRVFPQLESVQTIQPWRMAS